MQQRRLRPGDILDDYCPRERRVTNHVVVAMIEEGVKQTRCGTCDAEHEYKEAKSPVLRRSKVASAPVPPLPAAMPEDGSQVHPARADSQSLPERHAPPAFDDRLDQPTSTLQAAPEDSPVGGTSSSEADDFRNDDGSVHRRLIRATLPRPAGHVPERKVTEFTVRQPGARGREGDGNRGARFRGPRPQGQGHSNDSGPRFGGSRPGSGGGPGAFGGRPGRGDASRGGQAPGQSRESRPGAGRKRGR